MAKEVVAVNMTENEYDAILKAMQITTLSFSSLVRMIVKEKLANMENKEEIVFLFKLTECVQQKIHKSMSVSFDSQENEYKKLCILQQSTPMSASSIIKYFIMPEIKNINTKGDPKW